MTCDIFYLFNCLLCSNDCARIGFCLIAAKYSCQAKVWYFRVHVVVEEDVTSLHISVDDSQPRISMKVKKPSSDPHYDVEPLLPIQRTAFCLLCNNNNNNKRGKTFLTSIWSQASWKRIRDLVLLMGLLTEYVQLQALVGHVLIDQHPLLSMNTTSQDLDEISVLKLGDQDNLVLEFNYALPGLLG